MRGAWAGASRLDHLPDLGALALTMVICVVVSTRVFRWEFALARIVSVGSMFAEVAT